MGYTHYWTQTRSFDAALWEETVQDVRDILSYVENELGVPLANALGKPGTRPIFDNDHITFNGVGPENDHETFTICRKRERSWPGGRLGGDFCKTARKPYDIAATSCLCYLATVSETHGVATDGYGADFSAGLSAARAAVPRKANILDIPMDIMKKDRWTGPWISGTPAGYEVNFSIDGRGYVHKAKGDLWYRFETHEALGLFLVAHREAQFRRGATTRYGSYPAHEPDIWNATGVFDEPRHARIARAQRSVLEKLFPVPAANDFRPLAFVRPGELPRLEDNGTYSYSLKELLEKVNA